VVVTVGFGLVPDLLVKPARDAQPVLVQYQPSGSATSAITGG
jgi:hypothetical protein